MRRSEIFGRIDIERGRQDKKFPGQWVTFGTGLAIAEARAAAHEMNTILGEEIGEVSRAILERDDANLTVELVQCAAVIVAWLEGRPS